ncbi:MAG: type II/IV secretion system ATPase subunit [Candidatus Aenigmarchaeota archaeon]|nr:type II/IV secretion system ATPase subunit [Candidatus Aenigmarchaeota archaeon]
MFKKKVVVRIIPKKEKEDKSMTLGKNVFTGDATLLINLLKEALSEKKAENKEENIIKRGFHIPKIDVDVKLIDLEEEEKMTMMKRYPLIPRSPKGKVFAYVNIYWDKLHHEFVYEIIEPKLSKEDSNLLEKIKEFVEEKIDIDFTRLRKKDAIHYITRMFEDAISYFKVIKSPAEREILLYYVLRDFIGLGKIEPLMRDPYLEDISCDGVKVPIYVFHKDPRFGSMRTNIIFETKKELDKFVIKLAERCGKTISIANPLLDGSLPDGSRVQATLQSDIARRGSNFTIRKFSERPLTPVDLLLFGTVDLTMMSYLWLAVEYGLSILVCGGTASGKTTMLNVLSMFIKPQLKIVSIEDTAELRLAHPHWVPHVARVPIAKEGKEIDLYELLRESLRQRPDFIIVGEVRGKEAYVLFQQIALGHAGLATIHAENFTKLVNRLTNPPISLSPGLLENLDIAVFLERVKRQEKFLRRVTSVTEVVGFNREKNIPISNEVFRWDPRFDEFKIENDSHVLMKISTNTGISEFKLEKEFKNRAKVLQWLVKRRITDYRKVTQIISLYYTSKDYLLSKIEEEL